jgi:hypothetical protein
MKTLSLILFFIIAQTTSRAQQITNAAGNSNTVGSISIDWSFGELTLVDEKRSGSLIISQGVLQPEKEFSMTTTITSTKEKLRFCPTLPVVYSTFGQVF